MPDVITTSATPDVKTVGDFVALAKSRPGALNFGSPGIGSAAHLAAEKLKQAAGLDLVHVAYRSISDLFADLATGRIQLNVAPLAAAMPAIKGGQVRAIAVGGERRAPVLPEVPTMIEAGYSGYRSETWFGVVAPAGLPPPVVEQLSTAVGRIVQQAEVKDLIARQGAEPLTSTPEEFQVMQKNESVQFQRLIQGAGIRPE